MKKIVSVVCVLLIVLLFTGCDMFAKKIVEYVEIKGESGAELNTPTFIALKLMNSELDKTFGVTIDEGDTSTKYKVPVAKQEIVQFDLDASITKLKLAGSAAVKEVEYNESEKTLLITSKILIDAIP